MFEYFFLLPNKFIITGISGNEIMTYGAPNLIDLLDLVGPASNSHDWNTVPPSSPGTTDLTTPLPSPAAFNFSTPAKRRKK